MGIDKERWQVVSPLLDKLLEADQPGRLALLAKIRAEDVTLASELAALLAQQAAAEHAQFLAGAAFGGPAATLAGHVVGSYTLEWLLGEGGMGSVWLAHRSDGRYSGKAAVKFLNRGMFGRGGLERFTREGNLLARLSHPNIAHLIDAGLSEGQPYLVLEYVEGEAIDVWCDTHALDIKARVRLFLEVLAAVEHAHGRLILHRDLKPSNILVTRDGRVKLLDFGVAKLLQHDPDDPPVTQLVGRAFTPEYAAPEQVQGGEVSMATDVYALGVLLYGLLTGAHPTIEPGATPVERLRALVETEPRRPSDSTTSTTPGTAAARAGTPRQLQRELRGDLDNIIAKSLRKVQAERYPTASALAEDLRRYLDDEPVVARPDAAGYRLRKFVRRHRLATGAATATLLALLLGVVGTTWQAYEARQQRDIALQEVRYSRASHELVLSLLDEAFRNGSGDQWHDMLERSRRQLHERTANDPITRARLLLMLAGRYQTINDQHGESDVNDELAALAQTLTDKNVRAQITCSRADVLLVDRKVEAAAPLVQAALRDLGNERDMPLDAMAACYTTDAELAVDQGDYDRAVAHGLVLAKRYAAEGLVGSSEQLYNLQVLQRIYLDTDRDGDVLALVPQLEAALRAQDALDTTDHIVAVDRQATSLARRGQFLQTAQVLHDMIAREAGKTPIPPVFNSGYGRRLTLVGATTEGIPLILAQLPQLEREGNNNQVYFARFAIAEGYLQDGNVGAAGEQLTWLANAMDQNKAADREFAELARLQALYEVALGDAPAAQARIDTMNAHAAKLPRRARAEAMRGGLTTAEVALARNDFAAANRALDSAAAAEHTTAGVAPLPPHSAWRGAIYLLRARVHAKADEVDAAKREARNALEQFADTLQPEHPWMRAARQLAADAPAA
ncbi:MAG: serine/threonine-protein kinase [Pseudomonadota bacterium]